MLLQVTPFWWKWVNASNLTHHLVCREYTGLTCAYLAYMDSTLTIWKKERMTIPNTEWFHPQFCSVHVFLEWVWNGPFFVSALSRLSCASDKHLLVFGVILMLKDIQLFSLWPLPPPATSPVPLVEEDYRKCKGRGATCVSISSRGLQLM